MSAEHVGRPAVAFATISLHNMAGGLEKNIVWLANAMAERGYRVTLLTFDLPEATSFFDIDPRIDWVRTGFSHPHQTISFAQRRRVIAQCRAAILQLGPSPVVVCFHHGILLRFATATRFGLSARLICSERNSLTHYKFIKSRKWNFNFLAFALVRRITVQFPSYIQDYPRFLRRKIVAIPNPVKPATCFADTAEPAEGGRFRLLCVARHSHQKNIGVLCDAFSQLASRHPAWDLHILGDGELQSERSEQIQALKMEERIFLHGKTSDTHARLCQAHLFCLPSKWEGFPNALSEALSHGLPSVGFADCAGVRDLITSGTNGFLADGNGDATSLAGALERLMSDTALRSRMSAAAVDSVSQFAPQKVFDVWEKLINPQRSA